VVSKRLVIAEKPSVARDLCAALGGFEDHDGEYYESDAWIVTFALGHLLELAEPEEYDKSLKAWTLASLPILPPAFQIRPREGQKKRLDLIKKLATRKDVGGLVNACDAGREGEVIFRRIQEWIGDGRPHQRLWLQSMTSDAIRSAFEELQPGDAYDSLADAAWLRGVGDWLIGMNATRALTRRLKGRTEKGSWSAGRVQTPTLGLIVAHEWKRLAHVPRTYWTVQASFSAGDHAWSGKAWQVDSGDDKDAERSKDRWFERGRVDAIVEALAAGGEGTATEKRRESRENPPLPFDLTSLQREANGRWGWSAKRVLQTAQRLYEVHKVLTYPRTDSRHLPSDYRPTVEGIIEALAKDADFQVAARQIQADGLRNVERVIDGTKVSDHFAIVPTGSETPDDMGADDRALYALVVRQFLAAWMAPAIWSTVERWVEVAVPGQPPVRFRTAGKVLEVPGHLLAFGDEKGKGTALPPLRADGLDAAVACAIGETVLEEGETKPPARLSEGALLGRMEAAGEELEDASLTEAMKGRGLGTPATRADTIDRLITTGYAQRIDNRLAPTPKGMKLIDILDRAHVPVLNSARLTGEWEHKFQLVERGESTRADVLDALTGFTREVTTSLVGFDHDGLYAHDAPLGRCPSCAQGDVVETVWGYRCTRNVWGQDDGCKFFLWKEKSSRYIDRHVAEQLVREHRTGKLVGFADLSGRSVEASLMIEAESPEPGSAWTLRVVYGGADASAEAEVVGEIVFPCPCGEADCGGVVETSRRFLCQRLLEGKAKAGPVLPKVVCKRPIEIDDAAAYFGADAKTPALEGFISKFNRPFQGALVRKENGKHGFEFPERPPREGGRGRRGAKAPSDAVPAAKKSPAKKSPAKKAPAKKAPVKKPAAKNAAAPKGAVDSGTLDANPGSDAAVDAAVSTPSKRVAAAKKPAAKKAPAKKPAAKKPATKKKPAATQASGRTRAARKGSPSAKDEPEAEA
jgi:DNA topoisomerase-3